MVWNALAQKKYFQFTLHLRAIDFASGWQSNKVEKSMNGKKKWGNIVIWMIMNCGWRTRQRSLFFRCAKLCRNVIFNRKADTTKSIQFIWIYWLTHVWDDSENCWSLMHLSCRSLHQNILIRKFSWSFKNMLAVIWHSTIYSNVFVAAHFFIAKNIHLFWSGHWDTIKETFQYCCYGNTREIRR